MQNTSLICCNFPKYSQFCTILSQIGKQFADWYWLWNHILISTDLYPSVEDPRDTVCIPIWDWPCWKNGHNMTGAITCVASCEGGSVFKESICTGSFWIKQHLITSLENHGRVREIDLIAEACVLYTPCLRFSCSHCILKLSSLAIIIIGKYESSIVSLTRVAVH